ncbi:hypothetical protein EV651_102340 [Kribbella sp. VKM Ac-2571]|uniref:hypothetical protein n=1 Tax=Kribbella sp. VKM Ac-2571 TaxID=2512222 RepID=UPI00105DBCA3|nr:hypothetical protein [Kribbella sp. VKM Ac-2571]TDO68419.1 hypothetical protein EV651_102340 [Kribbella sp. VKM Ac-2571]
MADNLARAREKLDGQRRAVREHVEKWQRYVEAYEKNGALKTIQNAQRHIQKIKSDYPTLRNDNRSEDAWRPGDRL